MRDLHLHLLFETSSRVPVGLKIKLEMVSTFVPNYSTWVTSVACQEIRLEIYAQ
jgi:hypothetical protein